MWDFGDGTAGSGLEASHTYDQGGEYRVSLTVTKDGVSDVVEKTIMVQHPLVLDVADITDVAASEIVGAVVDSGGALSFDGNSYVNLGDDARFFGMQELNVSLDFLATSGVTGTENLLWNHLRYGISIQGDDLAFSLWTDTGEQLSLKVLGAGIRDDAWHNVSLSFDSATGSVVGYLDGLEVVRQDSVTGLIDGPESWDLLIGGGFGSDFTGQIDNLQIWTSADATVGDGSGLGGSGVIPVDFSSVFASLLSLAVDRAAQTGDGTSPASIGDFTIVQHSALAGDEVSDFANLRFDYDAGEFYGGFTSIYLPDLY